MEDRTQPSTATLQPVWGNGTVQLDAHNLGLTALDSLPVPGVLAERPNMPRGLFAFDVTGVQSGGIAVVDLTLPSGSHPRAYFKQDPTTGLLTRFDFNGQTGAIIHGDQVTLYLKDGGRGDADGIANGVVVDPGGPGGLGGGGGGSTGNVVISQVYRSGGTTDAVYNRDFIELFNPTGSTISLSGKSVQNAATGSGSWTVLTLSGSIDPGHYYLIGGASGSIGSALPTVDQSASVNLPDTGGKVALVDGTSALFGAVPFTTVIDEVGYGDADWFEGSGAAPASDPADAALRLGNGNYDTNDNQWDFFSDRPTPRNSASSAANLMPHVTMPDTTWTPTNTALTVTGISVTDPDAGTNSLEITVSSDTGTLTLASTTGLTFTDGDGTSDASMTFTATLTNIASALAGLTYTPETGYHGAAGISVFADDHGNSGVGGALFDSGVVTIVTGGQIVAADESVDGTEDTVSMIDVRANDAWATYTTPALTVATGPSHGTAVVDNNGTWLDSSDDVIKYTPNAEWHGTDSFTYQLSDGMFNTVTATVSVTVAQVNDAFIATTGDENMYNDEGESVSVRFDTPNATESLTWSATGLPTGLSINSSTGVISGRPQYNQSGAHPVTLTATGGDGDTYTQNLTWNISDVNRLPWQDDIFSVAGQVVVLSTVATDQIGNTLTYTMTGLPPGVTIDSNTGSNSGYPGQESYPNVDDSVGEYDVTLTVTGGGATDVREFLWTVVPHDYNGAEITINGTRNHNDDLGAIGVPLPAWIHSFNTGQAVKVKALSDNGNGTYSPSTLVKLTLDPSIDAIGTSEIDFPATSVAGNGGEFYILPIIPSTSVDDVLLFAYRQTYSGNWTQISGPGGKANVISAEIGTTDISNVYHANVVDATSTPQPMHDAGFYRIPPRNWDKTKLTVKIAGSTGGKTLWLVAPAIDNGGVGQSNDNGRVALRKGRAGNGLQYVELAPTDFTPGPATPDGRPTGTTTVEIAGYVEAKPKNDPGAGEWVWQTVPGHAGHLTLGLYTQQINNWDFGGELTKTVGFSVSAIPLQVTMTFAGTLAGVYPGRKSFYWWGTRFISSFSSDSGIEADLNEVLFREKIYMTSPVPKNAAGYILDNVNTTQEWAAIDDDIRKRVDNHAAIVMEDSREDGVDQMRRTIKARGVGSATIFQSHEFRDQRTGGRANPPAFVIEASGFAVNMDFQLPKGMPAMTVTKAGITVFPAPFPFITKAGIVAGAQPGQMAIT